jgi:hypothetical protein
VITLRLESSEAALKWAEAHFPAPQQRLAAVAADLLCAEFKASLSTLTPTTDFSELGWTWCSLDYPMFSIRMEETLGLELPDFSINTLQDYIDGIHDYCSPYQSSP